jgi:hypothetical protein
MGDLVGEILPLLGMVGVGTFLRPPYPLPVGGSFTYNIMYYF